MFSLEDYASGPELVAHDAIADFETSGAQRVCQDRDLIVRTDPRGTSATVLYFSELYRHNWLGSDKRTLDPTSVERVPADQRAQKIGSVRLAAVSANVIRRALCGPVRIGWVRVLSVR